MTVILHPGAAADIASAGDWYERHREGLALEFAEEIDRALEVISENPETWLFWPGSPVEFGIRRFMLPRFPFAVAYTMQGEQVIVLAVAHVRRKPGFWLERVPR